MEKLRTCASSRYFIYKNGNFFRIIFSHVSFRISLDDISIISIIIE